MVMTTCPNCGEQISDKAKKCVHCGTVLIPEEKKYCSDCGVELEEGMKVCPKCGCPIENAVEMEAAALYYLAAQHHVDALAIMTISDSLVNPDEDTTAEERQYSFTDMMKVGIETLIAD